ncbi:MAG: MotA/TolQ/ExbB proton channel family protein, partial [Ignavibacteriae bacterium]|nr:MotA/TolQ/ExbB proton channel family protein [Ignavibacteriota bacterium]
VLLIFSEAIIEFFKIKKNPSVSVSESLLNFRNWYGVLIITIASIIGFYWLSTKMEKFAEALDDQDNFIKEFLSNFLPGNEITGAVVVKILIMTLIVRIAFRAYLKMHQGKNEVKESLKLLLESKIIKSNSHFSLSSNDDLANLKKHNQSLKNLENKNNGLAKENLSMLIAIINSLIKTKDIITAKSTSEIHLTFLENRINKRFSESKVAQSTLPLLGFAGTIIGIMIAMGGMAGALKPDADPVELIKTIKSLSVAFDTTLVAVICAFIVRSKERKLLNDTSDLLIEREEIIESGLFSKFSK